MIKLFPPSFDTRETDFSSNGLGRLNDAVSCIITEELNGEFELEMRYPVTGIHYADIVQRGVIVADVNPYSNPQPFVIYRITKPINHLVTIYARHISYNLSYMPAIPVSAYTAKELFDWLNHNPPSELSEAGKDIVSAIKTTQGTVKYSVIRDYKTIDFAYLGVELLPSDEKTTRGYTYTPETHTLHMTNAPTSGHIIFVNLGTAFEQFEANGVKKDFVLDSKTLPPVNVYDALDTIRPSVYTYNAATHEITFQNALASNRFLIMVGQENRFKLPCPFTFETDVVTSDYGEMVEGDGTVTASLKNSYKEEFSASDGWVTRNDVYIGRGTEQSGYTYDPETSDITFSTPPIGSQTSPNFYKLFVSCKLETGQDYLQIFKLDGETNVFHMNRNHLSDLKVLHSTAMGSAYVAYNALNNKWSVSGSSPVPVGEYWCIMGRPWEIPFDSKKPQSIRALLKDAVDAFGGEYEFDGYHVKLHTKRGETRNVTIRYGKNLTDFKYEEQSNNVYSGVWPFWFSNNSNNPILVAPVDLVTINNTSGTPFDFERIYILDVSRDANFPSGYTPTQAEVRELGRKYLEKNKLAETDITVDVSFIDLTQSEEYRTYLALQEVRMGDLVKVVYNKYNLSLIKEVCATEYDAIAKKYNKVTLSQQTATITKTIANNTGSLASNSLFIDNLNSGKTEVTASTFQNGDLRVIVDELDSQNKKISMQTKESGNWKTYVSFEANRSTNVQTNSILFEGSTVNTGGTTETYRNRLKVLTDGNLVSTKQILDTNSKMYGPETEVFNTKTITDAYKRFDEYFNLTDKITLAYPMSIGCWMISGSSLFAGLPSDFTGNGILEIRMVKLNENNYRFYHFLYSALGSIYYVETGGSSEIVVAPSAWRKTTATTVGTRV